MEIGETFYPRTREAWREWLERHHADRDEVWLVTYRKAAGKPSVAYNDAVEEALCFGWIDSVRKSMGDQRLAQRFSPRRAGSGYSQINLERLARLLVQGRVLPEVAERLGDIRAADFRFPPDIMTELRSNPDAWEHFKGFSPSYQRIRVAYVDAARDRPEEFRKRLDHLIRKTAAGRQFGYGIESFY